MSESKRSWQFRIQDILKAADRIESYIDGMDFGMFEDDQKTADAVQKNLQDIGEAANHLPDDVKKKFPNVPWRKIIGMRHIVAHAYFSVSLQTLWDTASVDVPQLKEALKSAHQVGL